MKKNNKIIALGLGLSLFFAPVSNLVSNNINLVYAAESQDSQEEKNLEEFVTNAINFVNSDEFKALDEEKQNEYKDLIKDLNVENLDQEKFDKINKTIDEIKLSYEIKLSHIKDKYDKLKKELEGLNVDNLSVELSDELKKEIDSYEEDPYKTYSQYFDAVDRVEKIIKSIGIYNKDLKSHKEELKNAIKSIKANKDFKIDLKYEEAVLANKNAKLAEIDKAIESLYNKKVEEENRLSNISKLKPIVDGEKSTKESPNYKNASKSLKEEFDKKIKAVKDAYKKLNNKEKVENVNEIISNYHSAFKKLDGDKNLDKYKSLVKFYNENRDKLSKENQKKYDKLVEDLKNSEDISLDSINNLKKSIEEDIKKDSESLPTGTLSKQKKGKIAVRKTTAPKVKRSRSFVRTGVKSVGIVIGILIIAVIAYLIASKKDKK